MKGKKKPVQALVVKWEDLEQFVVLTDNPTKTAKVIAKVEKKLQKETDNAYTSVNLREALRGKMVCIPFWAKEYDMLP